MSSTYQSDNILVHEPSTTGRNAQYRLIPDDMRVYRMVIQIIHIKSYSFDRQSNDVGITCSMLVPIKRDGKDQ